MTGMILLLNNFVLNWMGMQQFYMRLLFSQSLRLGILIKKSSSPLLNFERLNINKYYIWETLAE